MLFVSALVAEPWPTGLDALPKLYPAARMNTLTLLQRQDFQIELKLQGLPHHQCCTRALTFLA